MKDQLTANRPRVDRVHGQLCGSRCQQCGTAAWPARAGCHHCGSLSILPARFSATGTLITYSTVFVSRPGLPSPYTVGQVRLDEGGPVVFGHIRDLPDSCVVPCRVRLGLDSGSKSEPYYWFSYEGS